MFHKPLNLTCFLEVTQKNFIRQSFYWFSCKGRVIVIYFQENNERKDDNKNKEKKKEEPKEDVDLTLQQGKIALH